MSREVLEQPQLLAENAPRYRSELDQFLKGKNFDLVLLTARGSSDNAALYARYLIEIHLGIPVLLAAPSVLTRYHRSLRYPGRVLAVGISQSGAAPDVSEVIADLRAQGHTTLAITNTPGSRLTQQAETSLILGAGDENSIAATKTYSCSLLALATLVEALGADLPGSNRLPSDAWVQSCHEVASEAAWALIRHSPAFALARGYSFCTALETALKLMECALVSAKSYSTADFAHGPRALAGPGTVAVVYGEVPAGLEETGMTVLRAPSSGSGALEPLHEIIYGQWLALLVARARGLNPDRAQNLSKVTLTL